MEIITGDSFEELDKLAENSVHACITDPPYGLAFMGRDWDDFEPKEYQAWCESWAAKVLRVLKAGGHLLAFSGNRTHHRAFTGIEDAGFEIRDTLTWHYGSGFPKASDISKTIDKRAEGVNVESGELKTENRSMSGGNYTRHEHEATTDAAKEWDGWKTALKPATEYIVMARKPFDGATVDCVLEHGTGALNIKACRIDTNESWGGSSGHDTNATVDGSDALNEQTSGSHEAGRYPSNVIFDETQAEALDTNNPHRSDTDRTIGGGGTRDGEFLDAVDDHETSAYNDSGGPSRYFYTSKASKAERTLNGKIENTHPTVKPQDLMDWLVKLVTRENQIVLDPFTGSGTTGMACKNLNRDFIGIEQNAEYADIARVRCGLTPENPETVRDDDNQKGLQSFN